MQCVYRRLPDVPPISTKPLGDGIRRRRPQRVFRIRKSWKTVQNATEGVNLQVSGLCACTVFEVTLYHFRSESDRCRSAGCVREISGTRKWYGALRSQLDLPTAGSKVNSRERRGTNDTEGFRRSERGLATGAGDLDDQYCGAVSWWMRTPAPTGARFHAYRSGERPDTHRGQRCRHGP